MSPLTAPEFRAAHCTAPKLPIIAEGATGRNLCVIGDFIALATSEAKEIQIANELARLSAEKAESIVSDLILTASAQARADIQSAAEAGIRALE